MGVPPEERVLILRILAQITAVLASALADNPPPPTAAKPRAAKPKVGDVPQCQYQWHEMSGWTLYNSTCPPGCDCGETPSDPSPGTTEGEIRSNACPGADPAAPDTCPALTNIMSGALATGQWGIPWFDAATQSWHCLVGEPGKVLGGGADNPFWANP